MPTLSIPADWLASGPLIIMDGFLPYRYVIHSGNSTYHPYVTHRAVIQDGEWEYMYGNYFKTLEEAQKDLAKRLGGHEP